MTFLICGNVWVCSYSNAQVGGDMDYDMSSEEIQYVLAHLFCRLVETNTDGLVSLEDLMEM